MSVIAITKELDALKFDAQLHEKHDSDAIVTSHPTESGTNLQDHVIRQPRQLTMRLAAYAASDYFTRLLELQDNATLFDIVTGLRIYPNMVIHSVSAERDHKTSRILHATVIFNEIKMAETVDVRLVRAPTAAKISSNSVAADKQNAAAEPVDQGVVDSISSEIADELGHLREAYNNPTDYLFGQ